MELGCLDYSVSAAQCADATYDFGFDKRFYSAKGIRWVKKATTQAECDAYGTKCDGTPRPSVNPSTFTDFTFNASFACKNRKNVFTWTPGKWYPGTKTPNQPFLNMNRSTQGCQCHSCRCLTQKINHSWISQQYPSRI